MTIPAPPSDGKNVSELPAQQERDILPLNEATTCLSQPEQPTSIEGFHNSGIEQDWKDVERKEQEQEQEQELEHQAPDYGDNFVQGALEVTQRKEKQITGHQNHPLRWDV